MERQPNPREKGKITPKGPSKYHMWCRAGMRQKSKTLPFDIIEPGRNLSAGASDSSNLWTSRILQNPEAFIPQGCRRGNNDKECQDFSKAPQFAATMAGGDSRSLRREP